AAFDLLRGSPAAVNIYGADFYLGAAPYADLSYLPEAYRDVEDTMSKTLQIHNQQTQREQMRIMLAEHDQLSGDRRFLRVLALDAGHFKRGLHWLWPDPDLRSLMGTIPREELRHRGLLYRDLRRGKTVGPLDPVANASSVARFERLVAAGR